MGVRPPHSKRAVSGGLGEDVALCGDVQIYTNIYIHTTSVLGGISSNWREAFAHFLLSHGKHAVDLCLYAALCGDVQIYTYVHIYIIYKEAVPPPIGVRPSRISCWATATSVQFAAETCAKTLLCVVKIAVRPRRPQAKTTSSREM